MSTSRTGDHVDTSRWSVQLSKFVRQIDAKLDDQQGYQDDIATMQSIQKSNKAFKKTIDHYLDLMLVEQRLSDIDKMDILELMNDLKVQKDAFKANIKNT